MRLVWQVSLCCLLAGGIAVAQRGGGGYGGGGMRGGGTGGFGGSVGVFRGGSGFNPGFGTGGGFVGIANINGPVGRIGAQFAPFGFRNGFRDFDFDGRFFNRGFYGGSYGGLYGYGLWGIGYWPGYWPNAYSSYVPGYDYLPNDYSPNANGYAAYQPSPNVTVYQPQAAAQPLTAERARPVTREYDPNGQEIRPPGSPLYLIAFTDHTIRAAITYRVEGTTLHYTTAEREEKEAPLGTVDRSLSTELNRERQLPFQLPPQ